MNFFKALKSVMFAVLLLLLVGGAFLVYQTRSDYYAKESVGLAASYAVQSLDVIRGHYEQARTYPADLTSLSMPRGSSGFVPQLSWNQSTGELTVEVVSDYGHFGALFFTRITNADGELRWRCRNGSVNERFLPKDCRS